MRKPPKKEKNKKKNEKGSGWKGNQSETHLKKIKVLVHAPEVRFIKIETNTKSEHHTRFPRPLCRNAGGC